MSTHTAQQAILLARRDELKSRQTRLHDHQIRAVSALSADSAERAVETGNDEVVDALADAVSSELAAIEEALTRIAQGSYGRCRVCQGPIAPARLAALPATDRCSDCAATTA